MVREDKENKPADVTLAAHAGGTRTYPIDPPRSAGDDPYVVYAASAKPSAEYAGIWDDVYASWSGLHGYVRTNWRGSDGSKVAIRDQIIHFVDVKKANTARAGVNFIHQSTTGMAHTITNGYSLPMTTSYEELYFSDCLLTSPAHASFTDLKDDRSSDLYIAHVPTLFNSIGSSNSETMAITKMIIVGGYLPPATKLLLKRNGLYPAALLSIWKAALPYDAPYDHELRHRIAYKSVGDRGAYPEKYSAARIDKGDKALPFHQYDDLAHMRTMVDLARSMDVAPPEAIFTVTSQGAGTLRYALRKAAVVVQEEGEDVEVRVATRDCYDLQGLPVTTRWKLLYGNKDTTVEPDPIDPSTFTIRVPWDALLPEGRTAIALIASNGRFDSNPAILTVYRKKSDIPPHGQSPGFYAFPGTFTNRRPILLDVQDQAVRRGRELKVPLRAIDPEGFPVALHRRAGEVGEIDGNLFVWRCPKNEPEGTRTVTIIASDETSGNSYAGRQITVHVGKPERLAHIDADRTTGPAPLDVRFTAKGSPGHTARTKYAWDVHAATAKDEARAFEDLPGGRDHTHTFEKPGLYTVALTMRGPKGSAGEDTTTVAVWVTEGGVEESESTLHVEGNGVRIRDGDDVPCAFDHTAFGAAAGGVVVRTFRITNSGTVPLALDSRKPVTIEGPHASDFKVEKKPRRQLDGGDSTTLSIRFKPKGPGPRTAQVRVGAGNRQVVFAIAGDGK